MKFEKPKNKTVFRAEKKSNKRVTKAELLQINQELYRASSTVWKDGMFTNSDKVRL